MNQNEIYAINHSFIIETVINIYLSYTSYIYIYLLYIFTHYIINIYKQTMENPNHKNTKIFTWKPSDWGENHGSFTNFKIYFAMIQLWLGQQPLTIYLTENKDSCDTIYFPVSLGGAPTPYKPTV